MYQKTIVVGHLGRDPEMRYTQSGVPVTSFSIATTRKWSSASGEQQEKTTWFRVTCWRKLAELTAQYLKKGRLVLVEGDIEAPAFTDREGNAQRQPGAHRDQHQVPRRPRRRRRGRSLALPAAARTSRSTRTRSHSKRRGQRDKVTG